MVVDDHDDRVTAQRRNNRDSPAHEASRSRTTAQFAVAVGQPVTSARRRARPPRLCDVPEAAPGWKRRDGNAGMETPGWKRRAGSTDGA